MPEDRHNPQPPRPLPASKRTNKGFNRRGRRARIAGWKSGPLGPRCSMKIDGLSPWWNVRGIDEMGSKCINEAIKQVLHLPIYQITHLPIAVAYSSLMLPGSHFHFFFLPSQ